MQTDMSRKLGVFVMATGIAYCDTSKEKHGDYLRVAFLPFSTLIPEWLAPRSKLRPAVEADMLSVQRRRGENFQISASGQTVRLGYAVTKSA